MDLRKSGSDYEVSSINEEQVTAGIIGVYGWMCLALIISGMTGLYIVSNFGLLVQVASNSVNLMVILAEFVIVMLLSARAHKMSRLACGISFIIYSILNGTTFAFIFASYGLDVVAHAFLVTAVVFGVMTVYGYITKTDLTSIGNLFVMALFGVLIVSLANLFIKSRGLDLALMYVGVVVFIGLIGYDTQRIKSILGSRRNATIVGALVLYLDFVNIFIRLVSIFSRED